MIVLHYTADLFAGLFFCNAIPHLTAGLCGEPFPTPFGKPPGVGHSSPLVNFLWSVLNLILGIFLAWRTGFSAGFNLDSALFSFGFILMGVNLSHYFGKVKRDKQK